MTARSTLAALIAAGTILNLSTVAFAQQGGAGAGSTGTTGSGGNVMPPALNQDRPLRPAGKPKTDDRFITEAARSGNAEIQSGRLALQQSQNPDVRRFAQQMIDEHTKANRLLAQLASPLNIVPPQDLDSKHQKLATRLARLSGPQFDQDYLKSQVEDHQKTLAMFQREADRGSDKIFQNYARTSLPMLQEHLALVQRLRAGNGMGTTGANANKGQAGGSQTGTGSSSTGNGSSTGASGTGKNGAAKGTGTGIDNKRGGRRGRSEGQNSPSGGKGAGTGAGGTGTGTTGAGGDTGTGTTGAGAGGAGT